MTRSPSSQNSRSASRHRRERLRPAGGDDGDEDPRSRDGAGRPQTELTAEPHHPRRDDPTGGQGETDTGIGHPPQGREEDRPGRQAERAEDRRPDRQIPGLTKTGWHRVESTAAGRRSELRERRSRDPRDRAAGAGLVRSAPPARHLRGPSEDEDSRKVIVDKALIGLLNGREEPEYPRPAIDPAPPA